MDLGQQCRGCMLKPIVERDAVGYYMKPKSTVKVGQLCESGTALRCRRSDVISRSEVVAKQLQEVPVE